MRFDQPLLIERVARVHLLQNSQFKYQTLKISDFEFGVWGLGVGGSGLRPLIMVDDNLHSITFYYRSRLFSATR